MWKFKIEIENDKNDMQFNRVTLLLGHLLPTRPRTTAIFERTIKRLVVVVGMAVPAKCGSIVQTGAPLHISSSRLAAVV